MTLHYTLHVTIWLKELKVYSVHGNPKCIAIYIAPSLEIFASDSKHSQGLKVRSTCVQWLTAKLGGEFVSKEYVVVLQQLSTIMIYPKYYGPYGNSYTGMQI